MSKDQLARFGMPLAVLLCALTAVTAKLLELRNAPDIVIGCGIGSLFFTVAGALLRQHIKRAQRTEEQHKEAVHDRDPD